MKTLADFKRALQTEGVQLETLRLIDGKESSGRLWVGQVRAVKSYDTTGVYLDMNDGKRGSFLGYDKASDWTFTEDTATHKIGYSYRVLLPIKA